MGLMVKKVQCRNFPEDLFQRLSDIAEFNERSLEGQVRFMLTHALNSLPDCDNAPEFPEWMRAALEQKASEGFRRFQDEILMRLSQSLASEGITAPGKAVICAANQ